MTIGLASYRRMFAEEIAAIANIRTPSLVEALATVPRERFLDPGPWLVRSEADLFAGPRPTPDDDPRRVYHNYSIAIDPSRQLFNGVPSLLASSIDRLALESGSRVLHVGSGLGYYTALIAQTVGPGGRVLGIEVDAGLSARARANLADLRWVELRTGDATGLFNETFDAILVNAGVTHVLQTWLDALADGGRLLFPLTAPMPPTGVIGKGVQILLTKRPDGAADAVVVNFVAIYSAIGLRDASLDSQIAQAFSRSPFPRLTERRVDPHEADNTCWLHAADWCLSARPLSSGAVH
ncbi:MAG TPA: methyltransferase domain-containing protein [Vicinamibacterales bacterium]|nr:methyltransferase domain-containing protein [Vicinamibacterales bacterium]